MDDQKKSRIDRLEEGLYSRTSQNAPPPRQTLGRENHDVNESWHEDESVSKLFHLERDRKERDQGTLFKKILIGSVIFFVISIGVASFVFFAGKNMVSVKNIEIEVRGPAQIAGGEELLMEVVIKNKNSADLESVTLIVEYPEGSRVAEDLSTELLRDRLTIGSIGAHREATKTVRAVLFGEKESIKNIKFTLEYRIKDSSALFYKDKNYEIVIQSAPIILSILYPKEVNSNQNFAFDIELTSNSGETLSNVLLKAEYPFGFTFIDANPKPITGNTVWRIGDFPSGEKKTIKINGSLQGQNEEERTFTFSTGIGDEKKEDILDVIFTTLAESIYIKKPFVGIDLSFDGDESEQFVGTPGQKIKANVVWTNNLSGKLLDMKIVAKLDGAALDRSSVVPTGNGFYRSVDNSIVWDSTTNSEFSGVDPGEKGVVGFTFAPQGTLSGSSNSQQISVSVKVTGNQLLSGVPESISSTLERIVKISSSLGFSGRSLHTIGPFENMGPIPPKADEETTYTIIWNLTNSLNDMGNVRVEGTLPSYMTWDGLTSPSSERISYDPINRRVTWLAGDLPGGTGFSTKIREAAFRLTLLPSLSQVGSSPALLTNIKATGDDKFVGKPLQISHPNLTTRTTTDPGFNTGDDEVVK